MKKILGVVFLGLMLFINPSYSGSAGNGDLTLSDNTFNNFMDYLSGGHGAYPMSFWITLDGKNSTYWSCPSSNCRSRGNEKSMCETQTGKQCANFALKSVVKWKNGTNTGHYKKSSFKKKWSDTEVRAKLTELGFLGGSTLSSTTTKSKITKKVTGNTLDLTKELKELKQLLDSEILTQDEFTELKENLLKKYKE
tara:strand:+ start:247 stop:831 length:585 start_codon:yes stop_codon:yes gene_type:complete